MREARIGTPMRSASHTTLAPPSMRELMTMAWLDASHFNARACGTLPSQR
jgi:hypothetical protein